MSVPRVIECDPRHQRGIEIDEIGKLRLVECQVGAAANLSLDEGGRRHDDIKSATARQHPRFQRLGIIEIRDVDLDASLFLE